MLKKLSLAVVLCIGVTLLAGSAFAQNWPEIFDPLVLRTINLRLENTVADAYDNDWDTIQNDETFSIEVPAKLWLDGEASITVAVRRKSGDALQQGTSFRKVSYRVDINEIVSGQDWHGLRAISLDNGDDENVLFEGMAWYLHRLASGFYGYNAGMASWVQLVINGVNTGVYCNSEPRDKRCLQNRGFWTSSSTWLYDAADNEQYEMKEPEGGTTDSPAVQALNYAPFVRSGYPFVPTPDSATLAAQLPTYINMQSLLTLAAVDSFAANADAIFSAGKNFYFSDWLATTGRTRLFWPWDQDSCLSGGGVNDDVYSTSSAYSQILLGVPEFHSQYTTILNGLINGPFSAANLNSFLDALEPVLSTALAADPNNNFGGEPVADVFAGLRTWFGQRVATVRSQIGAAPPDATPPVMNSISIRPPYVAEAGALTITVNATDNTAVTGVVANGISLALSFGAWRGNVAAGTTVGIHPMLISARDAAGNTTTYSSVSYEVVPGPDTALPTITSVTVTPSTVPQGGMITVNVNTMDNIGVATVTADAIPLSFVSGITWRGSIPAGTSLGAHTVTVVARDGSGNTRTSTSGSYQVTADTTPPVVSNVTVTPAKVAAGDNVNVAVNATDNVAVTGVTANGVALSPTGGSTWSGSFVASQDLGVHNVTILAVDAVNNTTSDTSGSYTTARILAAASRSLSYSMKTKLAQDFLVMLFGTVTVIDPDSFYINDGSSMSIKVIRTGHGRSTGDYVTARGILNVGVNPATLTCQQGQVVKLN